jgi:pilus assembly protein Flp/PilA
MNIKLSKLCLRAQSWLLREDGQDLVEYALVVALIAFGAVASMNTLASDINTAFTNIGSSLTSSI